MKDILKIKVCGMRNEVIVSTNPDDEREFVVWDPRNGGGEAYFSLNHAVEKAYLIANRILKDNGHKIYRVTEE